MLKDIQINGEINNKVEKSIMRLKHFEPDEGYYLAFSGGKDSITIKHLADRAGVDYDAHYNVTTIDNPELVYFIKENYTDVEFERPEKPFLEELLYHGFPIRQQRWCCEIYKEGGGSGRRVVTGIRKAESYSRSKRNMIESCHKDTSKGYLHPIIDWKDEDVWEYIETNNIKYCKLYDEGYYRLGCLFCPMKPNKTRRREAKQYPKYRDLFIRYFKKLYQKRKDNGKTSVDRWKDGEEMFWWWLLEPKEDTNDRQLELFKQTQ